METFSLIEAAARAGAIRKAAGGAGLTASARNRRIVRFGEQVGARIFERRARGVPLNPAGELVLRHCRAQRSDRARVQSQVAGLTGVRRGHGAVTCSRALPPWFLPDQIARYRRDHPGVTFAVNVRDRTRAEGEPAAFVSDLAPVFEPVPMTDFEVIHRIPQPVSAVMAADHPLAGMAEVRLRDCLGGAQVAPSEDYGVRYLPNAAARRGGRRLSPAVETESFEPIRHHVLRGRAVGFPIPVGLPPGPGSGLAVRPIAARDMPPGPLLPGQRNGRILPVATARFATRRVHGLNALHLRGA